MTAKIYADFDDRGFIKGFYEDDVFPDVVVYSETPESTEGDPTPGAPELSRTRHPSIPESAVLLSREDRGKLVGAPGHWRFDGEALVAFDPPPPPVTVPTEVTNYQARAALIQAGLFEVADQKIRAAGTSVALQAWDYANVFYRHSPIIKWMSEELDLDETTVDQLFIAAAQID